MTDRAPSALGGAEIGSRPDAREPLSVRRMEPAHWLTLLAALGLAAVFAPLIAELARLWRHDPYAGHGVFVPVYSAFLLWCDRDRLRRLPLGREPLGWLVVTLSVVLLVVGRRESSIVLQGLALVAAVAGLTLWAAGAHALRAAAFPVAFLAFMMPLPRAVVDAVTLDIQVLDARFAGAVLALLGVPSHVQGIRVDLPSTSLIVAEGCNGLRFLMALVTLTAAFAHVTQRTLARRAILVAAAVPVAVLANACRVATLCLAAYYISPSAADGLTHHSIGKGIWVIALVPLALLGIVLRRGGRRDSHAS